MATVRRIDLTDLDQFVNGFPHEVFRNLRRESPVWWHAPTAHTPDGLGFWVVSGHAECLAVTRAADVFSSERAPGAEGGGTILEDLPYGFASGVLLNMMDDPRHHDFRRLLTPALSPKALARLEADLRARVDVILDSVADEGTCDFLIDVAAELPLQATAGLMGVPQEDRHQLFEWADATLDYDDRDLGQRSDKVVAAQAEMFEYGATLIAEKRRHPGDDLLSMAAAGDTSDFELQMLFNLLVAAGTETTRNSIAVGLLALIDHPDQQDAWRGGSADRSRAVEEVLRWASSTTYNRRTATRDTELGGVGIAAGDKVTLWWASANRDEGVFANPDQFDIDRDPNPHLAFGQGTHFCLGANLARLEIAMVLEGFLARFDHIAVAGPVEWTRSNKHTGIRHLPITFQTRGTGHD